MYRRSALLSRTVQILVHYQKCQRDPPRPADECSSRSLVHRIIPHVFAVRVALSHSTAATERSYRVRLINAFPVILFHGGWHARVLIINTESPSAV